MYKCPLLSVPLVAGIFCIGSVAAFLSNRLPTHAGAGFDLTQPTSLYGTKKKRGQEKAREKAQEELRLRGIRSVLELDLRDVLDASATNKAGKARAVRKLIGNANHDGLADIGDKARTLAVKCLAAVGRYDEASSHLAVLEKSGSPIFRDDLDMTHIALQANAKAEKWDTAAGYADMLFSDSSISDQVDTSKADALNFAIQAYGNASRNLSVAERLMQQSADLGTLSSIEINSILEALGRSENYGKARTTYEMYEQKIEYDAETYRVGLFIASKLGDLHLAKSAFYNLKNAGMLSANDVVASMTCFSHQLNKNAVSLDNVPFAMELVRELTRRNKKQARMPRAFFSSLLENSAIADPVELRRIIKASKLVVEDRWPSWLSEAARIRAFPVLYKFDDAQKIMESLPFAFDMEKSMLAIGPSSSASSFWSAYLQLCTRLGLTSFAAEIVASKHIELDLNEGTMMAILQTILADTESACISKPDQRVQIVEQALKEVNSTLTRASETGVECSPSLFVDTADIHMRIKALGGFIDSINYDYTKWVEYSDLPDRELFRLSLSRLLSLLDAYLAQKEYGKVFALAFPVSMSRTAATQGKLGVLEFPFSIAPSQANSGNVIGKASILEQRSIFRAVTNQAIACDVAASNSKCMDEFTQKYHDYIVNKLWRNGDFVTNHIADFPAGDFEVDSLEDALWGETYRSLVLDMLEKSACVENWINETDDLQAPCKFISAFYTAPFFCQQKIAHRVKSVRKEYVAKMTKVFFARYQEANSEGVRKDVSALQEISDNVAVRNALRGKNADMIEWSCAASFLYHEIDQMLDSDSSLGISDKEEALGIVYKELLSNPTLKSTKRDMLETTFANSLKVQTDEIDTDKFNELLSATGLKEIFGEAEPIRERNLKNLIQSDAVAPGFCSLLAKFLIFGAQGRFPHVATLLGLSNRTENFDQKEARRVLRAEADKSGLNDHEICEEFANVVNCMIIELIDHLFLTGKKKDEKATVDAMNTVMDFMDHSSGLFEQFMTEGVSIKPVTYGGRLHKENLERLYSIYASAVMTSCNVTKERIDMFRELFKIKEKKAENKIMPDLFTMLGEQIMNDIMGGEEMEEMMAAMGGMAGLLGSDEEISPEQLKEHANVMKQMIESGIISKEEMKIIKEQFKAAYGMDMTEIITNADSIRDQLGDA